MARETLASLRTQLAAAQTRIDMLLAERSNLALIHERKYADMAYNNDALLAECNALTAECDQLRRGAQRPAPAAAPQHDSNVTRFTDRYGRDFVKTRIGNRTYTREVQS